jgi:hypothetical protein
MQNQIVRKLIDVEIKLGFLNIPAKGIEYMPEVNTKIPVIVDSKSQQLRYNAIYKRIFGLTKWYRKHVLKPGDTVILTKLKDKYELNHRKKDKEPPQTVQSSLIDISGLSSQAKGDIVEDRIKELIVLHGQGLLSVYKPVSDTHGIDLVVTKTGMFQPIFLQVKSRFNLQKTGYFLIDISTKTFTPHHSYFVVGAYFNPESLEIHEHILFVPSSQVVKANIVKAPNGDRYRITNHLTPQSKGKWAKYLIKKFELAEKLLEKFEEIAKYIR